MYSELIGHMANQVSGTPESLAAAAVTKRYAIGLGLNVRSFAFAISTATVSTGTIVVQLKKYPVVGSAAGAVVLSTLNILTGLAAGTVVYKPLDSITMEAGQELIVEVTTAAAGGGAAGAGYSVIDAYHAPEDFKNLSNAVLST